MRLIDADRFLEYMTDKCDMSAELDPIILGVFRGALKEQPTAYDIDKVVEELEKNKRKLFYFAKDYEEVGDSETAEIYADRAGEYIKAIEIVKSGGVSDDCCEWKDNYSNNQYSYLTSCDKIFEFDYDYNFCPYCGKKIKVVD